LDSETEALAEGESDPLGLKEDDPLPADTDGEPEGD